MLPVVILSFFLLPPSSYPSQQFPVPVPTNPHIAIQIEEARLDPPKLSPKKFNDNSWEFDWLTRGYGNMGEQGVKKIRVRVYSQERRAQGDKAPKVARMVMQIWDRAIRRLKIDSPIEANDGIVDYFLCFGGQPGGEQVFDYEFVAGSTKPQPQRANTIYIYQLSTFKDPVEMAREVAHEYGHAILPAVGGFKEPEAWANGYLGEKLFLKWIRNDLVAGVLTPDDAMGATAESLSAWVAKNVDPLVQQAASQFPSPNLIGDSKNGMDSFLGLALYVEATCPAAVFVRSLAYTQAAHKVNTDMTPPSDYAQNVLLAASEVENLTLSIPPSIFDSKKPIWIPLGKGTCSGATILTRKEGWALVAPLQPNIVIKNPPL